MGLSYIRQRSTDKAFVSWRAVREALMARAAPADQTKKGACATTTAVPTPPALPLSETQDSDCTSVRAEGGEAECCPWSPDKFDLGGKPEGIVEELVLPWAMWDWLEQCRDEWLEPGVPSQQHVSLLPALCESAAAEVAGGGNVWGRGAEHMAARP